MNAQAEKFFEKSRKWKDEYELLRHIVTENKSLIEGYKWMHPCYTFGEKNIVLIHGFKDYCALLFPKGVLLKDPKNLLIQQTKDVQAARQMRFTNTEQIKKQKSAIKEFIKEAIALERSGAKVEMKKVSDYPVPDEFIRALKEDSALKKAFESLTPGRQKGYLFYFNQAKQSKTREDRIEKYYQQILNGKGIND